MSDDDRLKNSKRDVRNRVGTEERRKRHRRRLHDRRETIRFEFKENRRSGRDRRRDNNTWTEDEIVD